MLVNRPGKLVVQLPGDTSHQDRAKSEDARYCDHERLDCRPNINAGLDLVGSLQHIDCIVDLVLLYCGIDKQSEIIHAKANDLNGVFEPQGIPHKDELINESKNEEGEVGWDRPGLHGFTCPRSKTRLELGKHKANHRVSISAVADRLNAPFESEYNGSLHNCDGEQRPRPW